MRTARCGIVVPTADGPRMLDEAQLFRFGHAHLNPPDLDSSPRRTIDRAVFGGYLFKHFGHFLLEGMARTWWPSPSARLPPLYISITASTIKSYMRGALDLVGAAGQHQVITREDGPVLVKELIVPDPGMEVGSWIHPTHVDRMGVVPARIVAGGGLAESAGVDHGGLPNEIEIEQRLAAQGWEDRASRDAPAAVPGGPARIGGAHRRGRGIGVPHPPVRAWPPRDRRRRAPHAAEELRDHR